MNRVFCGDNLKLLPKLEKESIRLIYIDPPFNSGKVQKRSRIEVTRTDGPGDRTGFGGRRYDEAKASTSSQFDDRFGDDYEDFLMSRIEAALPSLTKDGSLLVHLDCREVHYIKVALDKRLGRDRFMNEIIWSYDYGARSKTKWSAKHDNILWYVMDPKDYVFDFEAMDRIPYMAPELVGEEKAARGKTPTDCFWHTIVPTNGKEKTGYPTQKPLGILRRFVKVHSKAGDTCLDFFAGSGSFGEAAGESGRYFVLMDKNPDAVKLMKKRLCQWL